MKKLLIGLVAITGIIVVSCSKDYDCECTIQHNEVNSYSGLSDSHIESTHSTMTGKEDDVKDACKNSGFTMSYKDTMVTKHTITSTCVIK